MSHSVFMKNLGVDIDPSGAIDFYSGMISGLLEKNSDLPPLEECIKSSNRLIQDIDTLIDNLNSTKISSIINAVKGSADLIKTIPAELAPCNIISETELDALNKWATIFKDPSRMTSTMF